MPICKKPKKQKLLKESRVNKQAPKAIIMAGGTGGHIFPGIAVAKGLIEKGWQVSWLGSINGMEETLVTKANISIDCISVKGVRGNGIIGWLKLPFTLSKAVLEAMKIIRKQSPNVVLGFGGFVAGPGGIATKIAGVPLVIHEQNAVAGMTNKMLGKWAKKIFQAFPNTFAQSEKVKTVGNPIREEIKSLQKKKIADDLTISILVIGGSRGALALNKNLPKVFAQINQQAPIKVVHQVGKNRAKETKSFYQNIMPNWQKNIEVVEFIDDIAKAFVQADLVICRAGASTVSEIAAAGKAAIFVPFPYAVDDHQTANANWLVKKNAALLFKDNELVTDDFFAQLKTLISKPKLIEKMAENAAKAAILNATDNVVEYCEQFRKQAA